MAVLYWTWQLELVAIMVIAIFFFFYARYKFRIAREWNERDMERIKRIEETGVYEPPEKPYWR